MNAEDVIIQVKNNDSVNRLIPNTFELRDTRIDFTTSDQKNIPQITLPEYISSSTSKECVTSWNSDIEEYIKRIGQICILYQKMHSKKARKYLSKYNRSMYTSIMLGPLAGMLSAVNMNVGDLFIIPIIILSISFCNGILISIIKFRKWDEAALAHKTSSAKYGSLATSAQRQLTLSEKNRDNPDSYMKWITNVFNQIFVSSPIIDLDTNIEFNFIHKKEGDRNSSENKNLEGVILYEMNRLNRN